MNLSLACGRQETWLLTFHPFRLDLNSERLWRNEEELRLRRKPWAILRYLVRNPQRLVTQAEIVEAVWGKVAMSGSLLRTHIRDLRQVLGDGIVETVAGRGYRFVAAMKHIDDDLQVPGPTTNAAASPHLVVGRDAELEAMRGQLRSARNRNCAMVFVTGDAGVGKTTLVDFFLERALMQGALLVGRGACVEQYGDAEVYLPVFGALGELCRGPGGHRVVDVLSRHAPSWLMQMPTLVCPELGEELQRRASCEPRGRTMRELAEALDALSNDAPVVLVLEDLHWADPSTTDLLAALGARREPARVLIVGTYRTGDIVRGHPLSRVTSELVAHRRASTIDLGGFSHEVLSAYLMARFPGHSFPPELTSMLAQTTGGNALFVTTLVDDLEGQNLIEARDGGWRLSASIDEVAARRPDGIRRLIDTQIDRLGATEQRILEAAAVAGMTFTDGVVAHALGADADDIDSACESLATGRRLLQFIGTETWPDRTIQSRYSFVHSLFQHAARMRSTSATTRAWHRKIAERIEAGYADRAHEVAPELAMHFERGLVPLKAARYHLAAADRAGERYGLQEAIVHHERARASLDGLPDSRERDLLEMRAARSLGWKLFQIEGSIDAAVPLLERSREIAARLDEKPFLAEVLIALQSLSLMCSDFRAAGEHSRAIASLLDHVKDPTVRGRANQLEIATAVLRGDLREALRLVAVLGLDRPTDGKATPGNGRPLFLGMSQGAFAMWLAGKPDAALVLLRRALETAEAIDDLWARAALLNELATLHVWRGEPAKAKELAKRAQVLATRGGFAIWSNRAELLCRWAEVELSPGLPNQRSEEIVRKPWESVAGFGPTLQALLHVAACVRLGRAEQALSVVSQALESIERTGERWLEPELHRLRGESLRRTEPARAERSFITAMEVARTQSSASLELRAALSLNAHLSVAKRQRPRDDVVRALSLIEGGDDAPDVMEARRVLAS